uniref:FAD dependent oxidoreductase domain-containing protein n=1 Tax=Eutreptiella gymnastica TaxID=73025 RepID=A0A7S1NFI1_9EUGL|mmetsp:Transcript_27166/g.49043  ORF Transcript_27166/g.49043 Transcript_27166/m.49043 type:complete len:115 (+) Transcript_27166:88-432(+)
MEVVVVGAGVQGLSVALALKACVPEVRVTVVAEHFLQSTTSAGAAGLWEPYQIAGTPDALVNAWGKVSFDHFLELCHGPEAGEAGVQLMTAYQLYGPGEPTEPPSWRSIVLGFR